MSVDREQQARAVKATRLLDVLAQAAAPETLTGGAVRGLGEGSWVRAEGLAQVNPASPATRELVAVLADTRADLAKSDPFDCFPSPGRA